MNAPTLTAMSATLNVGQRAAPMPTSMKSTTPSLCRRRSRRLPTAPAQTSASEKIRGHSPALVLAYRRLRMPSATMVSAMNTHRENRGDPMFRPNAAPGLNTSVQRSALP